MHDGTIGFTYKGGNVGIGRSTNIDKKLHILSSTSGDGMTLEQSSTGSNAIRFEADSSALRGLFGSEDSDGGAILSGSSGYSMVLRSEADIFLATNGNNEALKIDTSQNATFGGDVTTSKANATGNSIILQQSLGSIASPSTSANTNILGKIQFVGKSTNDTPVGAEIKSVLTGTVGSAKNMPASLVFSTQQIGGADLATALTLDSGQNATFAGEVITPSGINFPDDASANPSSDVNTLDSYEEGDWTPTLTTNGTDFGSVTYDSLTGGRYTKIGNVVHFQGFLRTDAVTVGSASNDTAIGGLPFTAIASNGGKVDGQSAMNIGAVSGWAGENPSHGMVMGNTSIIQLYYMDYNVDAVNIASGSDVTAGTSADKNAIYFSGTYISS